MAPRCVGRPDRRQAGLTAPGNGRGRGRTPAREAPVPPTAARPPSRPGAGPGYRPGGRRLSRSGVAARLRPPRCAYLVTDAVSPKLLNEGEEVVLDLHPHWWYLSRPVAVAVVLLVATVASVVAGDCPPTVAAAGAAGPRAWLWLLGRYTRWRTTELRADQPPRDPPQRASGQDGPGDPPRPHQRHRLLTRPSSTA